VTCFDPMMSFFHFGSKERKMSGRPELDLKNFWELRLDLFKRCFTSSESRTKISIGAESKSFIHQS
jgi:hypothetical protein